MNSKGGIDRERKVRKLLNEDGYWTCRAAGSFGDADIVAAKDGHLMLIEVKATSRGPYAGFPPTQRAQLKQAAQTAGGQAWLVWWPSRKQPEWYPASEWP